jgi:hypothetical protein
MRTKSLLIAVGSVLTLSACASSSAAGPVQVQPDPATRPAAGGIPPERLGDIYLVLEERDASAKKCYQDVLDQKHTREFKGTVKLLLTLTTDGTAKNVQIVGGTLKNKEVNDCLVQAVKEFEFPKLSRGGDFEYEYTFEPQY